jgi:hypothetical protein
MVRCTGRSRWREASHGALISVTAAAALAGGLSGAATASGDPGSRAAQGHDYYVSPSGDDGSSGLSPTAAWRTPDRASAQQLGPGDRILLQRGGTYAGDLRVTSSGSRTAPVTIAAFGTGRPPTVTSGCVSLLGSWLRVEHIRATGCRAGFFADGAHDVVSHVRAEHNMYGVEIGDSASHARVERSRIRDNTVMAANTPGPTDDYGASGVVVRGRGTRVVGNVLSGHVAPSADFGQDGSAIEIFGARHTRIEHNTGRDNLAFVELGDPRTVDTVLTDNSSRSRLPRAAFLITRGPGDAFGPVAGTVAEGNQVTNTGSAAYGFWCGGGCTRGTLELERNVFRDRGFAGYVDGTIGGRDNVYAGGEVGFEPLPGDGFVAGLRGDLTDAVPL